MLKHKERKAKEKWSVAWVTLKPPLLRGSADSLMTAMRISSNKQSVRAVLKVDNGPKGAGRGGMEWRR